MVIKQPKIPKEGLYDLTGNNSFKSLFVAAPDYVGGYRLGNHSTHYVQFNLPYKPNWLHRQCMRIFLGWYWFDNK